MHIRKHSLVRWAGGLKTAAGFALTLTLLLVVNLFVYQKMRQLASTGPEPLQANELLRLLIVTDLFALVFLSGLVLLLNRQLALAMLPTRPSSKHRTTASNICTNVSRSCASQSDPPGRKHGTATQREPG